MTEQPTATGWQLRGSAAEAYEAFLVPVVFTAMADDLVAAARIEPGHRVLDVACGTGIVARAAAARVGPTGTVAGVDVNPDMLATARRATAHVTPSIDLREGDATALPFPDAMFDAVLCQQGLQFLPDPEAALREMARVAVPGGRVAVSVLRSLDHHPVYDVLTRALRDHVGSGAAAMMASPFALGDGEVLRAWVRAAGLADVTVHVEVGQQRFPSIAEFVRREAASSPLAGPLGELDDDRRAGLIAGVERDLAAHLDDDGLVFPNQTHVVVGHR